MKRVFAVVSLFLLAAAVMAPDGCIPPEPVEGPTAAFVASVVFGYAPLEVTFTDYSTPGTAHIRSWSWNFGDGGTSGARNPTYTYQDAETYTVSLTITTDDGTDTETKADYITVMSGGCAVDEVAVTFPPRDATVWVPEGATDVALVLMAESNCPDDTVELAFTLDDVAVGAAQTPPYATALTDLAALAAGPHEIVATATSERAPDEVFQDTAAFTLANADAAHDTDENGIPDNPFATLASEDDLWLAAVNVSETGQQRLVAATAWYGTAATQTGNVVLVLGSASNPAQRVTVVAPRALLLPGEQGVLIVQAAPDLDTLLGPDEAAQLGRSPEGTLVSGGFYVTMGLAISQDGGLTMTDVDPARLLENPLGLRLDGLDLPLDADLFLYTHALAVDSVPGEGVQVLAGPGFWCDRGVVGLETGVGFVEANLISLSAIALHEEADGACDYLYDDFNDGELDAGLWDTAGNPPVESAGNLDFSVTADQRDLAARSGGYRSVATTLRLLSYAGDTYMDLGVQWFTEGATPCMAYLGIQTDAETEPLVHAEIVNTGGPLWYRDVPLPAMDTDIRLQLGYDRATCLVEFLCNDILFASYDATGMGELDCTGFGLFSLVAAADESASAVYVAGDVYTCRHYGAQNETPTAVYVTAGATFPYLGTSTSPLGAIRDAFTLLHDGGIVYIGAGVYQEAVVIGAYMGWPPLAHVSVIGEAGAVIDGMGSNAGIVVTQLEEISLTGLEIRNCTAGIRLEEDVYGGTIEDTLLTDNEVGLDIACGGVTVRECTVRNNAGRGVLMHASAGGPTFIERCLIQDNTGRGLFATGPSFTMRDSIISGNREGGIAARTACRIENNTVADNTNGDGVDIEASGGSTVSVYNNIVTGNAGVGIDVAQVFGVLGVDYNNVWNNAGGDYGSVADPGENALSYDPLFAGDGDYHLTALSPCINAGSNVFVQAAERLDIDGEPRIQEDIVDIGADETPWLPATIVEFPDPNLEAAVRVAIGKPTGAIYAIDLVGGQFTTLHANDAGIVDLAGLEYGIELVTLKLNDNAIEDLTPLADLEDLDTLELGVNLIDDIAPLTGLTALTELDLSGNGIDNVSALADLHALSRLALDDNDVADLTPLTNLTLLRTLDLANNLIQDVQALVDNTGIGANLWIGADSVDLRGNPLGQEALCVDIPALLARGADVAYDGECAGEGEGEGESLVWAWGSNQSGQLGDGTTTAHAEPTPVIGLASATACVAGNEFSLAVGSDGTVWAWGANDDGQLGDGTTTRRTAPVKVGTLGGVVRLAAGASHSLALKSNGSVWAWGANANGQLGDGTTVTRRTSPVQVAGLTNVTQVAAGQAHSLALKSDGTVWAWGYNDRGQLGDGSLVLQSLPVQVSGLVDVVSIAAGTKHSVACRSDGTVWAWGANTEGQLGDGTLLNQAVPTETQGVHGVTQVAAGESHSLALTSVGVVWAWGDNSYGQLGDGTFIARKSPVQVTGVLSVAHISCGVAHSLAVQQDGTPWAWGHNAMGQLGDGTTERRAAPVNISGLAHVSHMAGGDLHSVAVAK